MVAVTRSGYQGLLCAQGAVLSLIPRVGRQQKIHSLRVKEKASKTGQDRSYLKTMFRGDWFM